MEKELGRTLREEDEEPSVDGQEGGEQVLGRQDWCGPFVVSWFHFTKVSNVGNVCDIFSEF